MKWKSRDKGKNYGKQMNSNLGVYIFIVFMIWVILSTIGMGN